MTPTMDPIEIISVDSQDSHNYLGDCIKESEDEILNEIRVDLLCSDSNVSLAISNNDEDSLFNELQDDSLFTTDFSCDDSNLETICLDKDAFIQDSSSSSDSFEEMTELPDVVEESLSSPIIGVSEEFSSDESPTTFSKFIVDVLNDNKIFTKRNKFSQIIEEIIIEDNNSQSGQDDENLYAVDDNACNDFEFETDKFDKSGTKRLTKIFSNIDCQNFETNQVESSTRNFGKFATNELLSPNAVGDKNSISVASQSFEFGTLNTLIRGMNKNIFTTDNRDLKIETELLKTENNYSNEDIVINNNLSSFSVNVEHKNTFFVNDKNENSSFLNDCNCEFDKILLASVDRVIEKNTVVEIDSNSQNFDYVTGLLKTESEVNGNKIAANNYCNYSQDFDSLTEFLKTEHKGKCIENAIVERVDDSQSFEYFVKLMRNLNHNIVVENNSERFSELMQIVSVNKDIIAEKNDREGREGLEYFSKLIEAVNKDDNYSRCSKYFLELMKHLNKDGGKDIVFEKYDSDSRSFELLAGFFENKNKDRNEIDSTDSQNFEDVKELLKAKHDKNTIIIENDSDSRSFEDVIELLKAISMNEDSLNVDENELQSIEQEFEMMDTTVNGEMNNDEIGNVLQNLENEMEAMETSISGEMDNKNLSIEVENEHQNLTYEIEVIKTAVNSEIDNKNSLIEVENEQQDCDNETEEVMKTAVNSKINKHLEVENKHQIMETLENRIFPNNTVIVDEIKCQNDEYIEDLLETVNRDLNKMSFNLNENDSDNDYELATNLLKNVHGDLKSDKLVLNDLKDVVENLTDDCQSFECETGEDKNKFVIDAEVTQHSKTLEDITNIDLEKDLFNLDDIVTQNLDYFATASIEIGKNRFGVNDESSDHVTNNLVIATIDTDKNSFHVNEIGIHSLESTSHLEKDINKNTFKACCTQNLEPANNFETVTIEIDKNTFHANNRPTQDLESTDHLETVSIEIDKNTLKINDTGIQNSEPTVAIEIDKNTFDVNDTQDLKPRSHVEMAKNSFEVNDTCTPYVEPSSHVETFTMEMAKNTFEVNDTCIQKLVPTSNMETVTIDIAKNTFEVNDTTCTQNLEPTIHLESLAIEVEKNIFEVNDACIQNLETKNDLETASIEIDDEKDTASQSLKSTVNSEMFTIGMCKNAFKMNDCIEDQNSEYVTELMETITRELNKNKIVLNDNDSQSMETITTENNRNTFVAEESCQNWELAKGGVSLDTVTSGINHKTIAVNYGNQNIGYETMPLEDIITSELSRNISVVEDNKSVKNLECEASGALETVTTEVKQNTMMDENLEFGKVSFNTVITEIEQSTINVDGNDRNLEFVTAPPETCTEIYQNLEFITATPETCTDIHKNTTIVDENNQNMEYESGRLEDINNGNTTVMNGQNFEFLSASSEGNTIISDQNSLIVNDNDNQKMACERVPLKNLDQDMSESTFAVDSNSQNFIFDRGSSKSATRFENEEFVVVNIVTGPEDEEQTEQVETLNKDLEMNKVVSNGDFSPNLGAGNLPLKNVNKKNRKYSKGFESKVVGTNVVEWYQDENANKIADENFDRLLRSVPNENSKKHKATKRNALNSIHPLNNLATKLPLKNLNGCEKILTKAQIMKPIDNVPDKLVDMECIVVNDLKFVPSSEEVILVKKVAKKKDKLPMNSVLVDTTTSTNTKENNNSILDRSSIMKENSILVDTTTTIIPNGFRCSFCLKEFKEQTALFLHESTHSKLKQYSTFYNCSMCNKNFARETDYSKHMMTHKDQKLKTCEICGKNFKFPRDLARHMLTHNGLKPFVCTICKKGFTQKKSLQLHTSTHNNNADVKPFECSTCGKSFSLKWNLEAHKLTHADARPFVCEICKVSFKQKKHLNDHRQAIHLKEQVFSCDKCDKVFSHRQTLLKHSKKHHDGVKPFTCDVCNKQFTSRTEITVHCRVHTGDRPYPCTVCGKRFRFQHTLKNHALLHSNERPYSCNICSKTFVQKCVLDRHQTVHTKEKKYTCGHCDKQFSHRHNLTRHKIVHKHL